MTREENIKAILECIFVGFKEEIINIATKRICELDQEPKTNDVISSSEEYKELAVAWIPVNERTPQDTTPVNITWVNHKPAVYYASIKDKPFTATACYCPANGKWYWYSVTCKDYLDEYNHSESDSMDDEIEVIAWAPLPKEYKEGQK